MDYKKAGVDIEAGYRSVELMKEHVKKTMRPEVFGGLGGFSGAFSLDKIKEMEEPVLLSGTDGCGTKVKLSMVLDKHDTIGIDAVAMCVNDIACINRKRSGRRMSSVGSGADRRRNGGTSGTYGRRRVRSCRICGRSMR
mgnify:CR=1 FL=1